jgi:hypothetical protein
MLCFRALLRFHMSFTLCTYAYSISYEYMSFGLEHIRNHNPFILIVIAYENQACLKPHSLSHTRGVVINHQKGGDCKHLGP